MRVIIPAAGAGQRFAAAGYHLPKPLIPVCGVAMLKHVLEMVNYTCARPVVVTTQEVYAAASKALNVDWRVLRYAQKDGAAMSVLSSMGECIDDEPVMIVDCDNIFDRNHFERFVEYAHKQVKQGVGAILTTQVEDTSEAWSFVRGDFGMVFEVAEKRKISNRVTCGANVWPSWRELRNAICRMVTAEDTTRGEYYLAPAYNHARHASRYFDIPLSAFHTVGTPEALQTFEQQQGYRR